MLIPYIRFASSYGRPSLLWQSTTQKAQHQIVSSSRILAPSLTCCDGAMKADLLLALSWTGLLHILVSHLLDPCLQLPFPIYSLELLLHCHNPSVHCSTSSIDSKGFHRKTCWRVASAELRRQSVAAFSSCASSACSHWECMSYVLVPSPRQCQLSILAQCPGSSR